MTTEKERDKFSARCQQFVEGMLAELRTVEKAPEGALTFRAGWNEAALLDALRSQ